MHSSRPPFFWLVALATPVILCAYVYIAYITARYGGLAVEFGWDAAREGAAWRVSRIAASGPADGRLQVGDLVLALNGNDRAGRLGPFYDFSGYEHNIRFVRVHPSAAPYTVSMVRDGAPAQVELLPRVANEPGGLATTISLIATSLSFFIVGIVVGLSRPRDELPRLLALASLPSAVMLLAIAMQPANVFLTGWEVYPRLVIANVYPFHYLLAYGFFFRVACGSLRPQFWSQLERVLWVGGMTAWAMRTTCAVVDVPEIPALIGFVSRNADAYYAFSQLTVGWQRVYNPVLTLALCAVLAANFRRVPDPVHHRRLKWIAYGTVIGLGPLFAEAVLRTTLAAAGLGYVSNTATYQFFYRIGTTAPIVVPIFFGYAIARRRLPGIQVVVRRSVQYLLARNVLRLAMALPVLGLVYTFATNADKTIAEVLLERSPYFYAVLLVAGVLSMNYRAQMMDWLDRRFFREAYHQERVLLALIDELKSCESAPAISRLVSERVQRALHPRAVFVFYRTAAGGDFELGHSSSGSAGLLIPEHFATVGLLQSHAAVVELQTGASTLPQEEQEWLRSLEVTMLIAMKGADERLCGLLLLGDKLSEEAYGPGDRELLQAIANQAAIVWENLWLKDSMRRERQIRREVLAHLAGSGINVVKECPACGRCFDRSDERCATDGSVLLLTVPVERTIEGRYRLERRLGRGAMGVVFEAFDERLHREVAVKVLHGGLFGAQEALRRFEREAQTSSRLTHANIVRTYDFGSVGSDGAYLVLELLRGVTWRHELNRRGSFSPPLAAARVQQLLDGLEAAHDIGLVHRDLKPENLMLCAGPQGSEVVKILDFGLAKNVLLQGESQLTAVGLSAPGAILGTYAYMAPEQLSGHPVDQRTDLFAVAVIAVESLTGRRPFRGAALTELVRSVLHDSFSLPGEGDEVRQLDACLQIALAKERAQRYPSAAAMKAQLVPALARCSSVGGSEPGGAAPDDATDVRVRGERVRGKRGGAELRGERGGAEDVEDAEGGFPVGE